MLAVRDGGCHVGATSAHGASYSWPTCQGFRPPKKKEEEEEKVHGGALEVC